MVATLSPVSLGYHSIPSQPICASLPACSSSSQESPCYPSSPLFLPWVSSRSMHKAQGIRVMVLPPQCGCHLNPQTPAKSKTIPGDAVKWWSGKGRAWVHLQRLGGGGRPWGTQGSSGHSVRRMLFSLISFATSRPLFPHSGNQPLKRTLRNTILISFCRKKKCN